MEPDFEGFLYPKVDVRDCINCGLCEHVCPCLNYEVPFEEIAAYVVQNKDGDVLDNSTSGGFVDKVNEFIIEKGGYVAGVVYDDCFLPTHSITNLLDDIPNFRNSKYAQSSAGDIFKQVELILQKGDFVVFTGTPCQVAGLKRYLRKDYEKLITIDLVCRSIPSPLLWEQYLTWQKNRYKSDIIDIVCRNKTYGYHHGSLVIRFKNGKEYSGSNRIDLYMKAFHNDLLSRPSCYDCKFKTKQRCSDFTVFDCWNPEKVVIEKLYDNDKGFSNVLIHSLKGKKLFVQLENIDAYQADREKMFLYTGGMESKSIIYTENRNEFYSTLKSEGFEQTMKKYVSVSFSDKAIENIKPLYRKIMHHSK